MNTLHGTHRTDQTSRAGPSMKIATIIRITAIFLLSLADKSFSQSAFKGCYVLYPEDSCFPVYDALKNGLLSQPQNIYKLQRAFYPIGKFASSRLINIFYNISFNEEILSSPSSTDAACIGTDADSVINRNTSLGFVTGWTSAEVFNILTSLQLSELQLELSNAVFSLFVIPGSGIYLPGRFGWVVKDKYEQRVDLQAINIVNLTISIDNISCIPDMQLIKSSLIDISTMVSADSEDYTA